MPVAAAATAVVSGLFDVNRESAVYFIQSLQTRGGRNARICNE